MSTEEPEKPKWSTKGEVKLKDEGRQKITQLEPETCQTLNK